MARVEGASLLPLHPRLGLAAMLGIALWLCAGAVVPRWVAAAGGAEFEDPTATATFDQGIEFSVTLDLTAPVDRVELLLQFRDSVGPFIIEVPAPTGVGRTTLRHSYLVAEEGHILPNTTVEATWRVRLIEPVLAQVTSDPVTVTYADDRFDWQTIEGDIVRVHWTDGDEAFGQNLLEVAEAGIARAEDLFGVTETEPVDFFAYADLEAFYDALGPGTRDNVGGTAYTGIRTLFALIKTSDVDDPWVGVVVPHELTHLVFDTAVDNPYHYPPRWLNEGLAVYLSEGYKDADRRAAINAAESGSLIPLEGLTGQFPTTSAGFFLAYSESVSAVEFMVRTYGQDAVVGLVASYADGTTDDEAFTAAFGLDTTAFNAAWFADLGGTVPPKVGPQPDPAGPLPAGWEAVPPTSAPGASSAPVPVASPGPAPGAPTDTSPGSTIAAFIGLVGLVVVGGVALLIWLNRGGRGGPRAPVTVAEDEPSQHGS